MELRKVTAIVRAALLEAVEQQLIAAHVPGITVTRVKGFGDYTDFYSREWLTEHMRIEIFTSRAGAERAREAIMSAARTGDAGDGIIAVLPVDEFYRIRDGAPAAAVTTGET